MYAPAALVATFDPWRRIDKQAHRVYTAYMNNTANTEDRGTPLTTRLEAEFMLMDAGADMHRLTFLRLYATSIISEPVRKARTLPMYSANLRNLVLPSAN